MSWQDKIIYGKQFGIRDMLRMEWFLFWHLTLPVRLWKLRGLKTCKTHGSHAQSWINGKCRECERHKRLNPQQKLYEVI